MSIRIARSAIAGFIALAIVGCASRPEPSRFVYEWEPSASARCDSAFLDRRAPIVSAGRDMGNAAELCFTYFAVLHSSEMRAPLWAAERLTPAMAEAGDEICREDRFHVEGRLPYAERAGSSDYEGYRGSWDRGHLVPADDMPDMESQAETFSLANMIPQASYLNQHAWAELEGGVNTWVEEHGEVYIVTGAIYLPTRGDRLNGRVGIPAYVFKAIYAPSTGRAIVYIADNRNDAEIEYMSLSMLEQQFGIVAFPSLPRRTRSAAEDWDLPAPERSNAPC